MAKKSRQISVPTPRRVRPAGRSKIKDFADPIWDGFPAIIVSPVRIISPQRWVPTLAHKLAINFGPDDDGNPRYMFALVSSLRRSPTDPDCDPDPNGGGLGRRLNLRRGWIFVNRCFVTTNQARRWKAKIKDTDWPIIAGGRVSAGSDGSEFIMELDGDGRQSGRVHYVAASEPGQSLYVWSNSAKRTVVTTPGTYAWVDGDCITVRNYASNPGLKEWVEGVTAAAELAGVRSAAHRLS